MSGATTSLYCALMAALNGLGWLWRDGEVNLFLAVAFFVGWVIARRVEQRQVLDHSLT